MIRILLLICTTLMSTASWAGRDIYGETTPEYDGKLSDIQHVALPPTFTAKTEPEIALCDYPLAVITKQMAFFRHGSPHKVVTLANGKEGWVYEIPQQRDRKRDTQPSGDRMKMEEVPVNAVMHTYTLVFDEGVVIDVIYMDDGLGAGVNVTATEMQAHKAQPMAEPPPFLWAP